MDHAQPDDLFREGAKTVAEAVAFSGIRRTELYRLMGSGEIRFSQHGRRRLIPVAELRRVLAAWLVPTDSTTEVQTWKN